MNISNMKLFSILAMTCVMSFGVVSAKLPAKKAKKKQDRVYQPKVLCIENGKRPKLVDLDVAIEELETKLREKGIDVEKIKEFDADMKNDQDAAKVYSWARALCHFKKAAVHIANGAIIVAWLTADFIQTKIYPLVYADPVEQFEKIVQVAQETGTIMDNVGLLARKKRYDEESDREYAQVLQQWEYDKAGVA